jgi:adenylate kinase
MAKRKRTKGQTTIYKTLHRKLKIEQRSPSYLDLRLEIDSEEQLRTKLYDKRDDFNFPIVNFPFICSNIPAVPAY